MMAAGTAKQRCPYLLLALPRKPGAALRVCLCWECVSLLEAGFPGNRGITRANENLSYGILMCVRPGMSSKAASRCTSWAS